LSGAFFTLKFDFKYSLIGGFSIRFNDNLEVAYFLLGHPVYATVHTEAILSMVPSFRFLSR